MAQDGSGQTNGQFACPGLEGRLGRQVNLDIFQAGDGCPGLLRVQVSAKGVGRPHSGQFTEENFNPQIEFFGEEAPGRFDQIVRIDQDTVVVEEDGCDIELHLPSLRAAPGTRFDQPVGASVPPNTCQARADLASRLSRM